MKLYCAVALSMALVLALLGGCQQQAPQVAQEPVVPTPAPRRFAIVVKDAENPYMQRMSEGFDEACAELGIESVVVGPGVGGPPDQSVAVLTLIEQGVDAVAVAANDMGKLSGALQSAMASGIEVVSLDAAVSPADRMLHIQQASPEIVGRVLIQASAEILGGHGQFAILTTTATMPNQQSWVNWMRREMKDYPDKYNRMQLVEVAYGLDQFETSTNLTRSLLERHPDLKLIIAPTVVGLRAAAIEIESQHSDVKVTGLGLPGDMEPHIESGTCPWMYLWNPSELGYLAAYALDALNDGLMSGTVGEILDAGKLGGRAVTPSEDGGTELVLGNPKMFDNTNIMIWKDMF